MSFFFKSLSGVTALLALSSSIVDARDSDPVRMRGCGSLIDAVQQSVLEQKFRAMRSKSRAPSGPIPAINVFFHVVQANETEAGGAVQDVTIQNQMSVINKAYEPTGFQFNLVEVDRSTNPQWFSQAGPSSPEIQSSMKMSSHKGGPGDLNVWTVGFENGPDSGLLGYATFPHEYQQGPQNDGVVILHSSLPGGKMMNYNMGHTLTHELGHWLGLYHTFQGGCDGPGDEVDDTPAELFPAQGCPVGRNTCQNRPGTDPVQNYMDYAYDSCMTNFSQGQIARMRDQVATFRQIRAGGETTRGAESSGVAPSAPESSVVVSSSAASSSAVESSVAPSVAPAPSAEPAAPSAEVPRAPAHVEPSPEAEAPAAAETPAAPADGERSLGKSLLSLFRRK